MGYYSQPDTFLLPVTFNREGSHNLYISNNSSGNYFADQVTINEHGNIRGTYIGGNAASTSYFAEDIILNADSVTGFINFYLGTATHAGNLLIGSEGYHSGVLTLRSYRQTSPITVDLSDLDHNTTLNLGPDLELEGALVGPPDVKTYLYDDCHFKSTVDITTLWSWGKNCRFEGETNLELIFNGNYFTGGNYFADEVNITQWGAGQLIMGHYLLPDTFMRPLSIILEGSHHLYLGRNSAGNYFADDVTLNHKGPVASRGFYIGLDGTPSSHFAGDIIMNVDTSGGFINFIERSF